MVVYVGDNNGTTPIADSLVGGSENDRLYGAMREDTLRGGAGDDKLYGWNSANISNDDATRDFLYGDAGNDTLDGHLSLRAIYQVLSPNLLAFR